MQIPTSTFRANIYFFSLSMQVCQCQNESDLTKRVNLKKLKLTC